MKSVKSVKVKTVLDEATELFAEGARRHDPRGGFLLVF